MWKYKVLFMLLLLVTQCMVAFGQNFNKIVLNDFAKYSTFVLIEVKSDCYSGEVIIENKKLYKYFQNTEGYNKAQYKLHMSNILFSKKTLELGNINLEKWEFIKVRRVQSVQQNILKGKDFFLDFYFKGIVIKDGIGLDEKNNVIAKLFEWNIATRIDDETGMLIMIRTDLFKEI